MKKCDICKKAIKGKVFRGYGLIFDKICYIKYKKDAYNEVKRVFGGSGYFD